MTGKRSVRHATPQAEPGLRVAAIMSEAIGKYAALASELTAMLAPVVEGLSKFKIPPELLVSLRSFDEARERALAKEFEKAKVRPGDFAGLADYYNAKRRSPKWNGKEPPKRFCQRWLRKNRPSWSDKDKALADLFKEPGRPRSAIADAQEKAVDALRAKGVPERTACNIIGGEGHRAFRSAYQRRKTRVS